jgi:hypothetical protein
MKKKVLIVFSGLALLLVGGGFAGHAWLKAGLKKESLVRQMEEAWNCRAHLDGTTVSLFKMPAEVRLIGLKLAPRDEEVAKPLAERAPLAPDAVLISAHEAVLSVELTDLRHGILNVEKLHLDGPNVRNAVDADGNGSLDALFNSPHAEEAPPEAPAPPSVTGTGGSAAPAETITASADPDPGTPKGKEKRAPKRAHKPMSASDMRLSLAVKKATISNGRFEATNVKGGTKTVIEHLEFSADIDLVPSDLANHNLCRFNVEASLTVDKADPKMQFANMNLAGSGTVAPFSPKTGEWNPDTDLSIKVRKGSLLGGALLTKQMKPKDLKDLAELGINLGDIALGGILERDAETRLHGLANGKLIVKQPTTFAFPQYEITIQEKSWFLATQDMHSVSALLLVSPELSTRIAQDAKKALAAKTGLGAVSDLGVDAFMKALCDKEGRLLLPYSAKGKLSDPKPDFGDLFHNLLKIGGKNLLDSLFGTGKPADNTDDKPQENR